MKYDIFISYKRRGTSSATAAYLYELLLKKGYNVFFDRKELRSGMFDDQLLTHISDAKDVIILLEDTSLAACFDKQVPDYYKSDWFCKEVMHALSLPGKNVIPILLEGYKMPSIDSLPEEMKNLSRCQALSLEISEVEEFYQKYFVDMEYLKSLPTNMSRFRQSRSNKASISNLLFFYEGFCYDINEYGEYITTIDENNDENHPYKHGVEFAGEHKILCINNDTCEHVLINTEVAPYHQKYICIKWNRHQLLWDLSENDVQKEEAPDVLFFWGKGLFEGTRTHEPNLDLSLLCFDKALDKHSKEAEEFIKNCWTVLCDKKVLWVKRKHWIERAAKLGVIPAMRYLGKAYNNDRNYEMCCKWYKEAIKNGDVQSMLEVAQLFSEPYIVWPFTLAEVSNGLADDLPDLLLKIEDVANGDELLQLGHLCNYFERSSTREKVIKPIHTSYDVYKLSAEKGVKEAYIRMGGICEDKNEYEEAICHYKKVNKGSNRILALSNIARCLLWLKRYPEAKKEYEVILNETSNSKTDSKGFRIDAYLGLAQIYEYGLVENVNISKAIKMYENILEEYNDDNDTALANLALLYETQSELESEKACEYYGALVKHHPEDNDHGFYSFYFHSYLSLEVAFCLAHAYTNGLGCDKDLNNGLKYYYLCSSYYSFINNNGSMSQLAKSDIKLLTSDMQIIDNPYNFKYIGFIYYEFYNDSKKAKDFLNKVTNERDFESTDLLNLISEENDGNKKNEKRIEYYLSNEKANCYKSLSSIGLLRYVEQYGRQLDRDSKIQTKE